MRDICRMVLFADSKGVRYEFYMKEKDGIIHFVLSSVAIEVGTAERAVVNDTILRVAPPEGHRTFP